MDRKDVWGEIKSQKLLGHPLLHLVVFLWGEGKDCVITHSPDLQGWEAYSLTTIHHCLCASIGHPAMKILARATASVQVLRLCSHTQYCTSRDRMLKNCSSISCFLVCHRDGRQHQCSAQLCTFFGFTGFQNPIPCLLNSNPKLILSLICNLNS